MKLKKGIMLYNEDGDNYECISINTGVVHHSEINKVRINYNEFSFYPTYETDAFLPKRDWRQLNEKEQSFLKATDQRTDSNTVYLGTLPDELRLQFEKLNLAKCQDRAEIFETFCMNPDLTKEINLRLDNYLKNFSNGKSFKFHYLGSNLPNLEVVAADTRKLPQGYKETDKKYAGIHNDGTKLLPIKRLHELGNRFTVNLGIENRSLFFINLTLQQAYNMLKREMK